MVPQPTLEHRHSKYSDMSIALKLIPCHSVISMQRLNIPVLPSIVTAALMTSILSAGNAYTFNASRSLHALALEGQAPKVFRRLNNKYVLL